MKKSSKLSFISGFTAFSLIVASFGATTAFAITSTSGESVRADVYGGVTDDVYESVGVRDDVYSGVTEDVYGGSRENEDVYEQDVADDVYEDDGVTDDVYETGGVADYVYADNEYDFIYDESTRVYVLDQQGRTIELSREVLRLLEEDSSILLNRVSVIARVPVAPLLVDWNVIVHFGDVFEEIKNKNNEGLLSNLYDISIFYETDSGLASINEFEAAPVTLTFMINPSGVTNWDNIRVVYIDEEGNQQEVMVPVSYDQETGEVTVIVNRLGIYGVYEIENVEEPVTGGTGGSEGSEEREEREEPENGGSEPRESDESGADGSEAGGSAEGGSNAGGSNAGQGVAGANGSQSEAGGSAVAGAGQAGGAKDVSATAATVKRVINDQVLPATSTNAFNNMMIGFGFVLVGFLIFLIVKTRELA
ncbi:hypothetical protein N0O92_01595 [Alkalihalobacillus sp. MEB130]|uniref:hypothetical protein n=1 Tax=Alkalihalobacillus sp. MEB130 TaxID=2976704 RepID=UPI0028E055C6|nr:hypothetical protein [Alkalihalobacillus sp. MEB130]MDT8858905.1 hypothetical protein [Alkalihalobacillus sp. MEB130]